MKPLQSLSHLMVSAVKAHTTEGIDLTIRNVVLVDNAAAETINYAKRNDINLLAMASHQRSGLIPWIADRNAPGAIQQLYIPVLLVRGSPATTGQIGGKLFSIILIPLDGSEAGEALVLYAKELAQQIKMEVFLLQVISSQQHVRTIGGLNYVLDSNDVNRLLKT